MATRYRQTKMSQVNELLKNAGTWMEDLARDNTRLVNEQVKMSADLAERNEELALIKVAHAYARAGRINYDDALTWVSEKMSAIRNGDHRTAQYYHNALSETMDLSPAELSGAKHQPAPRNKVSAPRNTQAPSAYSPVSATALASMHALRNL